MNTHNKSEKKLTYQRSDGRRNRSIVSRERHRLASKVAEDSSFGCYYRVEEELGVSRATVRYWFLKKKNQDNLHEEPCGGYRSGTFQIWERPVVRSYLVEFLTAFPGSTLIKIAKELSYCFSRNVTRKVRISIFDYFCSDF